MAASMDNSLTKTRLLYAFFAYRPSCVIRYCPEAVISKRLRIQRQLLITFMSSSFYDSPVATRLVAAPSSVISDL
jgi:hypothetical protein